jgi:hypothetical protein
MMIDIRPDGKIMELYQEIQMINLQQDEINKQTVKMQLGYDIEKRQKLTDEYYKLYLEKNELRKLIGVLICEKIGKMV